MRVKNNVKKLREEQMMSKTELAKRADVSVLTIDRIERGEASRYATKRKILKAFSLDLKERHLVFPEESEEHDLPEGEDEEGPLATDENEPSHPSLASSATTPSASVPVLPASEKSPSSSSLPTLTPSASVPLFSPSIPELPPPSLPKTEKDEK